MSQVKFATQFTGLLQLHQPTNRDIQQHSFPFGTHTAPFVVQNNNSVANATALQLDVTVKCIKPKLQISLSYNTTSKTLFHALKTSIIKELEENGFCVKESDLKLMLKTKSIPDSTSMDELLEMAQTTSTVNLNAMIKSFTIPHSEPELVSESIPPQFSEIKPETWDKILEIISQDLPMDIALETINKFKSTV